MKGIVFNLLEQVVTEAHSEDAWDEILERAGLEGAYTAVGSYDDLEFLQLVGAAVEVTGTPLDDLVRWFGREAIPHFARLYPQFFAAHEHTRSFVLTLNDVIHPEVRKLFPGADVPDFDFHQPDERTVALGYRSGRKLCAFAEGLVQGAAAHYGERVEISQPECMKRGDGRCLLVCTFEPAEVPVA